MDNLLEQSELNLAGAAGIMQKLGIGEKWARSGVRVELVGSVRTRLLMDKLDLDMHVYSEGPFRIADSFQAVGLISSEPGVREVVYRNLLDAEDMCLEWHLKYLDGDGRTWGIDMIHILNESPYAGKFERVADRINAVMTPEARLSILGLKRAAFRKGIEVRGIEIYRAVLEYGITDLDEFLARKASSPEEYIIMWEPGDRKY